MAEIKIFLIEPQELMRTAFATLIQSVEGLVVIGQAVDGSSETVARIKKAEPNVVVLSSELTAPTAAQFIKAVKTAHSKVRFLVLGMREDNELFQRLFRAGCNGYMLRSATSEDLFNAIQTVAGGASYVGNNLVDSLLKIVLRSSKSDDSPRLSTREEDIVQRVACGHTSTQIAKQMGLSHKTVDTYRSRALAKLGLSSRAELLQYALANGWFDQSESYSCESIKMDAQLR